MGQAAGPEALAIDKALALFATDPATTRHAYAHFVATGVNQSMPEPRQQLGISINPQAL